MDINNCKGQTKIDGVRERIEKIDTLLASCVQQVDAMTMPEDASCMKDEEPRDVISYINHALDGVLDKVTHLNHQLAILTNLL